MKRLKLAALAALSLLVVVGCGSESVDDTGKLQEAHVAVKEVYGDTYIPNMQLDEMMLEEIYGVNPDSVVEFIGEMPMISTHADVFIGIEAAEGKVDEVAQALTDFVEKDIATGFHYPQNMAKVQATEVLTIRNHVFLVRLGNINENQDATEADAATFATEEVQKGVDAINSVFGVE